MFVHVPSPRQILDSSQLVPVALKVPPPQEPLVHVVPSRQSLKSSHAVPFATFVPLVQLPLTHFSPVVQSFLSSQSVLLVTNTIDSSQCPPLSHCSFFVHGCPSLQNEPAERSTTSHAPVASTQSAIWHELPGCVQILVPVQAPETQSLHRSPPTAHPVPSGTGSPIVHENWCVFGPVTSHSLQFAVPRHGLMSGFGASQEWPLPQVPWLHASPPAGEQDAPLFFQ
jgi:hypothetical protein